MKVLKEWVVSAPWGDIALISWGNPSSDPVLLVHGRQDSAATFIPLLEHLPERYYVGLDLPGNGKSTPFPHGVKLTRFHSVTALAIVIDQLKWTKFAYIGHSMGCETGLFYNAIYPNTITRMVHLDMGPSLQRLQVHDMVEHYQDFYRSYYDNYNRDNYENKVYTKKQALEAVMKARQLTESQAEIILSRNITEIGPDQYKLSWDRRLKTLAPNNFPVNYYYKLFSTTPPSLLISASKGSGTFYTKGKEDAQEIIDRLVKFNGLNVLVVEGGHDVHFTHPERMGNEVRAFLELGVNSKL